MRLRLMVVALGGIGACSSLTGGGGVVSLRVVLGNPAVVEQGDTLTLIAQALDMDGHVVQNARIIWLTPDTGLVLEDSTGRVTSNQSSGTGRVQARVGSLYSTLQTLTIRRRSDTLALASAAADTVLAGDTASAALGAAVLSLTPDTAGISNTRIRYAIVTPTAGFHFVGGVDTLSAATGSNGEPAPAVTLRRNPSAGPATLQVSILALRPSRDTVPGSGQTFTVTFE